MSVILNSIFKISNRASSNMRLKAFGPLSAVCGFWVVTLSAITCLAQKPSKPYKEDLSAYRPKFELKSDTLNRVVVQKTSDRTVVKATKNVNAKLDVILDSIDKQNLQKKFVEGFTIQIYSGQSKEEAMAAKQKVVEEVTELIASLQYFQPKFRVSTGSYFSKLEAQKDLLKLKAYFPGAIVVPEKIQIR